MKIPEYMIRDWWTQDGRGVGWPDELIDKMHRASVEGYNQGMIQAGHPELVIPLTSTQ